LPYLFRELSMLFQDLFEAIAVAIGRGASSVVSRKVERILGRVASIKFWIGRIYAFC
jgi:hypothetical protein